MVKQYYKSSRKCKHINIIKNSTMNGGSVPPLANTQLLNTEIILTPTLKSLITKDTETHAIILYNGIKLTCKLGKNNFKVGTKSAHNPLFAQHVSDIMFDYCIRVQYSKNKNNFVAILEEFFYSKTKESCIGKDKIINNTTFKNSTFKNATFKTEKNTQQQLNQKYNKKFNMLLLTLIDIFNVDLNVSACSVNDGAIIRCALNNIIIPLSLKQYERGYGFYNEFGYMYIASDNIVNVVYNDDVVKEKITFANYCLDIINSQALSYEHHLYTEIHPTQTPFKNTDYIVGLLNTQKDSLRTYIKNFMNYICNIDKDNKDTIDKTIDNLNKVNTYLRTLFEANDTLFEENDTIAFEYTSFIKYYTYKTGTDKVFSTELNKTLTPHTFELKPFVKPTITINKYDESTRLNKTTKNNNKRNSNNRNVSNIDFIISIT